MAVAVRVAVGVVVVLLLHVCKLLYNPHNEVQVQKIPLATSLIGKAYLAGDVVSGIFLTCTLLCELYNKYK